MIAQVCELEVGELIIALGDAHIYNNHVEQVQEQISRTPLALPKLSLNPNVSVITDFVMDDVTLLDYQSHDAIKAPMAV